MPRRLEARLTSLRRRLRATLLIRGLCWVGFAAGLAFLVGTTLDWFVPLTREMRALALLGLAIGLGWLAWRHLILPLTARLDDLMLAIRVERRYPGLRDQLSSSVEFLRTIDDPDEQRHGSRALRQATVEQTLKQIEAIDFRQAIDPRSTRMAAALFGWTLGAVGLMVVLAPAYTRLAASRWLMGNQEWPRPFSLVVEDSPRKVARGDSFVLAVSSEAGKELPVVPPRAWRQVVEKAVPALRWLGATDDGRNLSTARVTYEFEDGQQVTEPLRPDDQGRFHGRIETVSQPFKFRVTGGDETTPWTSVAVVPPPMLTDVVLTVKAPAYTRPYLDPAAGEAELLSTLAPGLTRLEALAGGELRVTGKANKPLVSASLVRGEQAAPVPVPLGPAKDTIVAKLPIEASGPFSFSLLDLDGFKNRESTRFELRVVADEPPRVVFEEPTADLMVSAKATVPLRVLAEDDHGLQLVRASYSIAQAGSEPTQAAVIPLWASEKDIDQGSSTRQVVDYAWDLAPLNLAPNTVLTIVADARDFYRSPDGSKGPNEGKSRELRVRIISDDEFRQQLDDQRRDIREELQRVLDMQKQALTPVQEAKNTLEKTPELDRTSRDALNDAELLQQQVTSRVGGPSESIQRKVEKFLRDLEGSKLADDDARQQMDGMREAIDRMRPGLLQPAEQNVARAARALSRDNKGEQNGAAPRDGGQDGAQAKGADAKNAPPKAGENGANDPAKSKAGAQEGREALAQAEQNQKGVAEELERMLDGMRQFETLQGMTRDAEKLLTRQEEAIKQSAEAASRRELVGKTPEQLNPKDKADLENLGNRQEELARDLQNFEARLNEMGERVEQAGQDPLAAAALKESAQQSREQGTAGQMREAAKQLSRNQIESASKDQQDARQKLQEMVDGLKNRRENDLARLVKELKDAEKQLRQARQKQADNLAKNRAAGKMTDPKEREAELQRLAKEQKENEQQLRKQIARLQKLRADAAAKAGARAASKMSKAGEQMEQGEGEQAEQEQEEALADLEEAEREAREARQQAEDRLLAEQFSKIRDQLAAVRDRQDKILKDTTGYEAKRQQNGGRLSRAESFDVRALSRVQGGLKEESSKLAERLEPAPVFALTLRRAIERMEQAAAKLQALETGSDAQRAETEAIRRIDQLITALKPDPQKPGRGGQQQGGGGGGGGGGGDGIPTVAQIKMLRALQEDINTRTDELDEIRRRKQALSDDQKTELERLQDDQRLVADMTRDLVQPKKPDGLEE